MKVSQKTFRSPVIYTVTFFLLFTLIVNQSFSQIADSIITNLGSMINGPGPEINPKISADGKKIFFTRIVKEGANTFQQIFYSEKDQNGNWIKARNLDEFPFNEQMANSVVYVSADGNSVIIKGVFENNKLNEKKRGYSWVKKTETGAWGKPETMFIEGYDKLDKGLYNGMYLGPGGNVMILSMTPEKGGVNNDLYVSFRKEDETWSKPELISKEINLPTNEFAPFLASDGVTLYFASDRTGGMGNSDIYKTKRLDDSWLSWSEPKNLGDPVNTKGREGYYVIDATSEYAYMARGRDTLSNADLVKIRLNAEQKAEPVVLIYGRVYNSKTKKSLSAKIIYEQLPQGTKLGEVQSNPKDGTYKIILPYGKKYGFLAQAQGYLSVSHSINLLKVYAYKEIQVDLELVPIEVGENVRMNNIFFEFNSATLNEDSYPELNRVIEELNVNPTMSIEVQGHTDNVGTDEYNLRLSSNRAETVKKYLLSKGIPADRVTSKGYGESKPEAGNDTEEGRAQNRRVTFLILKK